MHVVENGFVDGFLGDSVFPPLVGARAAEGVLAALREGFHARLEVAL